MKLMELDFLCTLFWRQIYWPLHHTVFVSGSQWWSPPSAWSSCWRCCWLSASLFQPVQDEASKGIHDGGTQIIGISVNVHSYTRLDVCLIILMENSCSEAQELVHLWRAQKKPNEDPDLNLSEMLKHAVQA